MEELNDVKEPSTVRRCNNERLVSLISRKKNVFVDKICAHGRCGSISWIQPVPCLFVFWPQKLRDGHHFNFATVMHANELRDRVHVPNLVSSNRDIKLEHYVIF